MVLYDAQCRFMVFHGAPWCSNAFGASRKFGRQNSTLKHVEIALPEKPLEKFPENKIPKNVPTNLPKKNLLDNIRFPKNFPEQIPKKHSP